MGWLLASLLVVLLVISNVQSLTLKVEPHQEECVYEVITAKNIKMQLNFQVTTGGFLDIDVTIYGPDHQLIHSLEKQNDGKFSFTAEREGQYKFCFSNMMSTLTPKSVSFDIIVGESIDETVAKLEHLDPIEKSIMRLSEQLASIQQQQQMQKAREAIHRELSEITNKRVVQWNIFSVVLLAVMGLWQIYYFTRFFESKRVV